MSIRKMNELNVLVLTGSSKRRGRLATSSDTKFLRDEVLKLAEFSERGLECTRELAWRSCREIFGAL
jgi:hypothetical protein